ncbi:flagellar protein export ATPase FliI [Kozakia baliensis]|uniref:flagellar protein export ATPase FliI n=1 Tax=Kozakia baliensis TaxID=153496 RepID=UPI00087B77E6|nr:flagellar protein export ATPase FliI [Kozakia baliensis]
MLDRMIEEYERARRIEIIGHVREISGLCVVVAGLKTFITVGDRVELKARSGEWILAEVVGFKEELARLMAFGSLDGIGPGADARIFYGREADARGLAVSQKWLGRVLDPLGRPIDDKAPLAKTYAPVTPVRRDPPTPTARARLGPRFDLGVRALDVFTTCRIGQRLGLFAGSGVGKSSLLSMLARYAACDVTVIALVGERGREVREFIEDDLGEEGLRRAVVVVATSDMPPLMRREAAYAATAIAEYFRDQGKSVFLLMDSVTRFCLALREIGLSTGEPPATRGYPPSVFAELPRLLERAGPGARIENKEAGFITALFTVLVEGDEHNEPVADAVRGILDGHVILERQIAEGGRYPAINILRSLSRSVPGCNNAEENNLTQRARAVMANYDRMSDMIRLGAYKNGTDPEIDEAIGLMPKLNNFLKQGRHERSTLQEGFQTLRQIMNGEAS